MSTSQLTWTFSFYFSSIIFFISSSLNWSLQSKQMKYCFPFTLITAPSSCNVPQMGQLLYKTHTSPLKLKNSTTIWAINEPISDFFRTTNGTFILCSFFIFSNIHWKRSSYFYFCFLFLFKNQFFSLISF